MSSVKWLRRLRGQRGQVLVIFVGIFCLITLMGAISIDFGLWLSERRGIERAADFAALAGSQDLLQGQPNDDQLANDNAIRWAERNGYKNGVNGVTVTTELLCRNRLDNPPANLCRNSHTSTSQPDSCSVGGHCDAIRVTISKPGPHLFSKMFNIGVVQVGFASAAGVEFETDVVLVIDRSGSMGKPPLSPPSPTPNGQLRIYWAKEAAKKLVDQLAGSDGDLSPYRVSVISFAGSSTAAADLDLGAETTAAAVDSAIDSITTGGSTYIAPALTAATGQLNTLGRADANKVVILLSDGRNWTNSGESPDADTRRTNTVSAIGPLQAAADTVFSVGVGTTGTDASDLDEPLLQMIAEGPPGEYYHVTQASDLPDIFQKIAWKIAGRALTE